MLVPIEKLKKKRVKTYVVSNSIIHLIKLTFMFNKNQTKHEMKKKKKKKTNQ